MKYLRRKIRGTFVWASLLAISVLLIATRVSSSDIVASWKWSRVPYDLAFVGDSLVINNGNLTDANGISTGPRLARYSKAGVQQWIQTYPTNATPQRMIATQDGGVAVAGWKWTGVGSNYKSAVWKFTGTGALAWETTLGSAGLHLFFDVAEMPDGSLIAVGYSEGAFDGAPNRGGRDAIAAKLTSGGALTWKAQEGGTGDDYFFGVDVAPTGEIMAVGYSNGTFLGSVNQGGFDGIAVELSSDGDVIRHVTRGTAQEDQFEDVLFYQANSAIIVGSISGDTGLVAGISSGAIAWTHEAGSPPSDQFTRVGLTPGGTFWVAGLIDTEVILKEMTTSGSVIRERKRPQSAGDIMGLAVDSSGEVWTAQYEGWVYGGVDNPVPTVSLAGSAAEVGVNSSVTFTATASVVGGSIASYEWDLDGNGSYETSGGASQVASWSTLGNRNVGVRVISESGVPSTAQKMVSVCAVPNPPTAVTASLTGRRARIQWQAPSSNGGTPILDYAVKSTDNSVSCTTAGLECSISNLTPGSTYQFEVAARNVLGLSSYTTSQSVTVADLATAVLSVSTATALTGKLVVFDASDSAAASGRPLVYKWDMDGDNIYEQEGASKMSRSWDGVGRNTVRVQVTTPDGSTDSAVAVVVSYLAPPAGEVGISINGGYPYTNTKNVTLDVVWPSFATRLRVSNDGGFRESLTEERNLAAQQAWTLDDRVAGQFTKIVYIRLNGLRIDSTRTHTDDIIFDNTAPVLTSVSAQFLKDQPGKVKASGAAGVASDKKSYLIQMRAKDNRSGLGRVQANDKKSSLGAIKRPYSQKVVVRLETVKPLKFVWVRVEDRAGNWSRWQRSEVD